jgi:hypothetical protein
MLTLPLAFVSFVALMKFRFVTTVATLTPLDWTLTEVPPEVGSKLGVVKWEAVVSPK